MNFAESKQVYRAARGQQHTLGKLIVTRHTASHKQYTHSRGQDTQEAKLNPKLKNQRHYQNKTGSGKERARLRHVNTRTEDKQYKRQTNTVLQKHRLTPRHNNWKHTDPGPWHKQQQTNIINRKNIDTETMMSYKVFVIKAQWKCSMQHVWAKG